MMKEKKKTKNQNPPSMVVAPRWGVVKVCETITAKVNNQNNKGVTMNYNNETPLTDLELINFFLQNTEGDVGVEGGHYQQVKNITRRVWDFSTLIGLSDGQYMSTFGGSTEDYVPTEEGSSHLNPNW